jgi:Kef-type K+ transport system membrane component KefB
METDSILLDIAFILLAARVFGEIASRFNIPPIIGELVAGIILGPSLLGWVEPNNVLALLAEIGIILLLFEVGLETDIGRLAKAGSRAAVVALVGFILPFILGVLLSFYVFNLSLLVSLFIGGTLTATSIGITARVLSDMGRIQSQEGQIVLGAAVIDDLLGVFLLAVLFEFSVSGSVSLMNTGKIVLYAGAFFLIAPVIAKLLVPIIKHYHFQSSVPGMLPIVLVSLVLIFASAAHALGAPELLGGFVAGIALSRRFFLPFGAALTIDPEFAEHTHQQMRPIIQLFTPLFFVMVGLSLDLKSVDWSSVFIWVFSLTIAATAILGKMVGPWFLRETVHRKIAIGMAMVPRGEVGLIFAELGRSAKVFDAEVYAGMVMVIAYTTLFSPIWIKSFYSRYGHHLPADR